MEMAAQSPADVSTPAPLATGKRGVRFGDATVLMGALTPVADVDKSIDNADAGDVDDAMNVMSKPVSSLSSLGRLSTATRLTSAFGGGAKRLTAARRVK
jgi:hypothetical protein